MQWNLRLAAANRGIWKASELHRMLAERGMMISAGKTNATGVMTARSMLLRDRFPLGFRELAVEAGQSQSEGTSQLRVPAAHRTR
jgi:hypothetical protein